MFKELEIKEVKNERGCFISVLHGIFHTSRGAATFLLFPLNPAWEGQVFFVTANSILEAGLRRIEMDQKSEFFGLDWKEEIAEEEAAIIECSDRSGQKWSELWRSPKFAELRKIFFALDAERHKRFVNS